MATYREVLGNSSTLKKMSGNLGKVGKWHKSLNDLAVLLLYEAETGFPLSGMSGNIRECQGILF